MIVRPAIASTLCVLACLGLGACAGMKLGDTPNRTREIPPGPGLFSGSDGEFVLFGPVVRPKPAAEEAASTERGDANGKSKP